LLNGEHLGVAGGIAIWFVSNTFVTYWYHRCQHRFSILWRMVHQLHHGVARVDIPSALVAHPLDVIVSTTLSILVTAFLLGLDPRAVVMTGVLQFFMTLFPHWNVRTPKWVDISSSGRRSISCTINATCMRGIFPTGLFGTKFLVPIVSRLRAGADQF